MQMRSLILAAAASLMLAPAAIAATMTPAAQCTALEKQFDQVIGQHSTAAKYNAAKALRADAGKLCASGNPADGVKKLDEAFRDIGVKPTA
jgi:hypothetical protein